MDLERMVLGVHVQELKWDTVQGTSSMENESQGRHFNVQGNTCLTSQCKLRYMCALCPICMRRARGQVEADPGNKAFAPAGGRFDPWD